MIFLIILLVLLLSIEKVRRNIKKLQKNKPEIDKLDFVMRPPNWVRICGLIWIAIGIFVMALAIRNYFLGFALAILGFTILGIKPLRKKIVVQGNRVLVQRFFRKDKLTFDDISEIMIDQYAYTELIFDNDIAEVMKGRYSEVKCFNFKGKKKLKFTSDWSHFHLMMQLLFDLGILPWLYTRKNKKDRKNLIKLMIFFIDNDLTTWYSFNKRKASEVGFKLYRDDLTDEGQYLFTSGAVLKWYNFAHNGGDVSDFSLLQDTLVEYERLQGKQEKTKGKQEKVKGEKEKKGIDMQKGYKRLKP